MSIEPVPLGLRPAVGADHDFRFAVFVSTRLEELTRSGWSPDQQAAFLKIQFAAQEMSYNAAFPNATTSLVCLGDTPAGIIVVDRASGEIRLVNIALLPAYRGRGFGRQLIESLQQEARLHHRPLRLHVLNGSRAQRLYARLGFNEAGENGLYLKMEWKPTSASSASGETHPQFPPGRAPSCS